MQKTQGNDPEESEGYMLLRRSCVDSPHSFVADVAHLLCASDFSICKQALTYRSLRDQTPRMAHMPKLAFPSRVRSSVVHVHGLMTDSKWR